MKHSYIIIDDSAESILKTLSVAARFQNLHFVASANSYNEGLDLILEHRPSLIFLEINPENKESNLSLMLINELHRYLKVIPKIIVTTNNSELAIEAIKYGAFDYLSKPVDGNTLRRTILKFEKMNENSTILHENPKASSQQFIQSISDTPAFDPKNSQSEDIPVTVETNETHEAIEIPLETEVQEIESTIKKVVLNDETHKEEKPLIICVKSYGDYRFIEAKDICYLQADNNSTDIHLYNGEMITAFKTLKHFENVLSSPFVRLDFLVQLQRGQLQQADRLLQLGRQRQVLRQPYLE